MKILFASHTSNLEGAEMALYELVRGLLNERTFHVHVLLPTEGPLLDKFRSLGVESSVIYHDWWASTRPSMGDTFMRSARSLRAVPRLLRLLTALEPDALVVNTLTIPTPAIAANLLRIPIIWNIHEFGVKDHGLTFDVGLPGAARLIRCLSARVLVNSEAVRTHFARWIPPSKLRLVYQAVEVPASSVPPATATTMPFCVALVARKHPGKGQEDALRAAALLRARGRDLRLYLVGAGSPNYLRELQFLVNDLRLDDCVEFVAFTTDPYRYFRTATVVLMCSRSEGFGRVTIEAMKFGRPVIGARSGATAELIRHGENGLLYEPGDVRGLAEKIDLLYRDPSLTARLGATAQAWATRTFTLNNYVAAFTAVLKELLPKGPIRSSRSTTLASNGLIQHQPQPPSTTSPEPWRTSQRGRDGGR